MDTGKQSQKKEEQKQQIDIDMEKSLEDVKDPELKEMFTMIWGRNKISDTYKASGTISLCFHSS